MVNSYYHASYSRGLVKKQSTDYQADLKQGINLAVRRNC